MASPTGVVVDYERHPVAEELGSWSIDYERLLSRCGASVEALRGWLEGEAGYVWRDVYRAHFPRSSELQVVELPSRRYLYDCSWSVGETPPSVVREVPDDRVVVAYGVSQAVSKTRDKARMRGFPRGGLGTVSPELRDLFDRGHYLGRALGGGEDINLFPQWAPINRGRSEAGKVFRRMERYCERNRDTAFFMRPFYFGISDHPAAVELGIVRTDASLWVGVFPNVPTLDWLQRLDEALIALRSASQHHDAPGPVKLR